MVQVVNLVKVEELIIYTVYTYVCNNLYMHHVWNTYALSINYTCLYISCEEDPARYTSHHLDHWFRGTHFLDLHVLLGNMTILTFQETFCWAARDMIQHGTLTWFWDWRQDVPSSKLTWQRKIMNFSIYIFKLLFFHMLVFGVEVVSCWKLMFVGFFVPFLDLHCRLNIGDRSWRSFLKLIQGAIWRWL